MSRLSAGAVEHIAASSSTSTSSARPDSGNGATQPALRKSMSRVLSRVLSITRKEQPPVQAIVKSPPKRAVYIDRGYEVIPRVTSTHLSRSRDGQGLSESDIDRRPSSLSASLPRQSKPLPLYTHPALHLPPGSQAPASRPTLEPRRPSVTTKLSRGQIAKFRQASINASSSRVSLSTTISSHAAGTNHPRVAGGAGGRRHLASSRSTAEMKSRSSGELPRPPSWASASSINTSSDSMSTHQSPSANKPSDSTTRFPYVCPDRLIQRSRPNTPSRAQPHIAPPQSDLAVGHHTPSSTKAGYGSYRKPVPTFVESPCSTQSSMQEVATPPRAQAQVGINSDSLDSLFDEVMRGCMPEPEQMSTPRPLASNSESASLIIGRPTSQVELLSRAEAGDSGSSTPTKRMSSITTTRPVVAAKRFIPSGRSFEPLKSTRLSNLPGQTAEKQREGGGSRVKEVIAKFEKRISADTPPEEPSTPVKVLGSIIHRPPTVSSAGLSDESRRMMWEKRQNRGIR